MRVLYDGWPLIYPGWGPGALHLWELLESCPDGVDAWLALPGQMVAAPPPSNQTLIEIETDTPAGWLRWQQYRLPSMARRCGADLLHTTALELPLTSSIPCLVSPAAVFSGDSEFPGVVHRFRKSLGRGGLSNARAILWPEDLPDPPLRAPIFRLPAYVHSAFWQTQLPRGDLPEDYILVPGPLDNDALGRLAATWSWIKTGLGEDWTLLVSDFGTDAVQRLEALCRPSGADTGIYPIALRTPEACAAVFQQARIIFNAGSVSPWGDGWLSGLASARPLAGVESAWADARVGPAGYLASGEDPRALGAAVLTLAVETGVADQLSQAAQQRATQWGSGIFGQRLGEIYQQAG